MSAGYDVIDAMVDEVGYRLDQYPHRTNAQIARGVPAAKPKFVAVQRLLRAGATPTSFASHDETIWFLMLAARHYGFGANPEQIVMRDRFFRCDLAVYRERFPWLAIEVKSRPQRTPSELGRSVAQVTRYADALSARPILTWSGAERGHVDGVSIMSPTHIHLMMREAARVNAEVAS